MRHFCRTAVFVTAALFVSATVRIFPKASVQSKQNIRKSSHTVTKVASDSTDSQISRWYRVRQGDSLYTIARAHGTSVRELKSLNQLRTNRLKIGQSLRLPSSGNAGAGHTEATNPSETVEKAEAGKTTVVSGEAATETDTPEISAAPDAPETRSAASSEQQDNHNSDAASQPLRVRLASMGIELLGVRYRWSGNSEVSGFDCSGLVKSLFDKFNISLPRTSREQYQMGEKVEKDKLEVGDLVFFSSRRNKMPSHVGIYIGDNQFLHAARKARRVIVSSLSSSWYMKRFLGARRLADLWAEEPLPSDDSSN